MLFLLASVLKSILLSNTFFKSRATAEPLFLGTITLAISKRKEYPEFFLFPAYSNKERSIVIVFCLHLIADNMIGK